MKKYPTKVKICCPMCEGRGFMEIENKQLIPRNPYIGKQETKDLRNKLRELNRKKVLDGLSLREIGALVGLKSPQLVKHHILMLDKLGWEKFEN